MNYEIVELPKKLLAGITKHITEQNPPMSLWGEYYSKTIFNIEGIVDTKAYGLYFDFAEGCTAMIACETSHKQSLKDDIVEYTIPAGKYAKFCLQGEVHHVVPLFWRELDSIKIERSFLCDFEVFPNSETENVDIEIYVSIK